MVEHLVANENVACSSHVTRLFNVFYSYLLLLKEKKTEIKQDLAKTETESISKLLSFLLRKNDRKLISKIQQILNLQCFVHNMGISYPPSIL